MLSFTRLPSVRASEYVREYSRTSEFLRGRHRDGRLASARFLPGSPARAVFACWGGHQRASTGVPKRAGVARLGWE
jgi:hypothetical protein